MKTIGAQAFYCTDIIKIKIPNKVTYIGYSAFRGSTLVEITIPKSVTYIGENIFEACYKLKKVKLKKSFEGFYKSNLDGCEVIYY